MEMSDRLHKLYQDIAECNDIVQQINDSLKMSESTVRRSDRDLNRKAGRILAIEPREKKDRVLRGTSR